MFTMSHKFMDQLFKNFLNMFNFSTIYTDWENLFQIEIMCNYLIHFDDSFTKRTSCLNIIFSNLLFRNINTIFVKEYFPAALTTAEHFDDFSDFFVFVMEPVLNIMIFLNMFYSIIYPKLKSFPFIFSFGLFMFMLLILFQYLYSVLSIVIYWKEKGYPIGKNYHYSTNFFTYIQKRILFSFSFLTMIGKK